MTAILERRYRRLLACYPREHRRRYEDEMLTVLLAVRSDGRWPTGRDAVDVLRSALVVRLRLAVQALRDDAWLAAAYATQLFGTILLAAVALRRVALTSTLLVLSHVDPWLDAEVTFDPPGRSDLLRATAWALALGAVLAGLRRTAVALTGAATAVELGLAVEWYGSAPSQLWQVSWLLAAALTVLLAALAAAGRPPGAEPRGRSVVAAAGVLVVAAGVVDVVGRWASAGVPGLVVFFGDRLEQLRYGAPLLAVAAVLVVVAVRRLPAETRRRVWACASPVAVMCWLALLAHTDLVTTIVRPLGSVPLVLAQWVALVGGSVGAFVLAAAWVHRREGRLRLLELGRAADRGSTDGWG